MDYGPSRRRSDRGTLGSVIAANLSGASHQSKRRAIIFWALPRSPAVQETIKSGGRVVKNVTGYDLCKVLAVPGARSVP